MDRVAPISGHDVAGLWSMIGPGPSPRSRGLEDLRLGSDDAAADLGGSFQHRDRGRRRRPPPPGGSEVVKMEARRALRNLTGVTPILALAAI